MRRSSETDTRSRATGWIGGHVHGGRHCRFVPRPPHRTPNLGHRRPARCGHQQQHRAICPPHQPGVWLYAQVFTHPQRLDGHPAHPPAPAARRASTAPRAVVVRPVPQRPRNRSPSAADRHHQAPEDYTAVALTGWAGGGSSSATTPAQRPGWPWPPTDRRSARYGPRQCGARPLRQVFAARPRTAVAGSRCGCLPAQVIGPGGAGWAIGMGRPSWTASTPITPTGHLVAAEAPRRARTAAGRRPGRRPDQAAVWASRGTLPRRRSHPRPRCPRHGRPRRAGPGRSTARRPARRRPTADRILSALLHMHHNRAPAHRPRRRGNLPTPGPARSAWPAVPHTARSTA